MRGPVKTKTFFSWNKRKSLGIHSSNEKQVRFRPGWFECGGKRTSAPRSHKRAGWRVGS